MTEPGSESTGQLEKLLLENADAFRRVDFEGDATTGCRPPRTVVCAGTTCHQTAIIVAIE
jgi:hypothetical protein